jgi:hypothetical protein
MNEKAVFDIGNLLHVRWKFKFIGEFPFIAVRRLTAEEITETRDFKAFERDYPELTKYVLEGV